MEDDRDPSWTRVPATEALLPPLCPGCLGPGEHLLEVPRSSGRRREPQLLLHLCASCSEAVERARTRRWAVLLAASLLGVLAATGAIFEFGARAPLLQLLLASGAALLLPLALELARRAPNPYPPLVIDDDGPTETLLVARREYARLLPVEPLGRAAPPRPKRRVVLVPLLVTVLFWCAAERLGKSEVWVLTADQDLFLLVDHRLVGEVPASLEETPSAGRFESLLAGKRHFSLVHKRGEEHAAVEATLTPGRTYLFALPAPGRCFFLDRLGYGQAGPTRERAPLEGPGPFYSLPRAIDAWFTPLPPAEGGSTTGGSRTALRLLPCKAPGRP